MVNFKSELPRWEAEGVTPPESAKKDGWKAGQRPPADYFNWFFSKTYFALKELQEESARLTHLDAHKNDKKNPHGVTAEQVGLGNLTNQKQATKVEFDAHYEDKVRHITKDERETWNSKASGKHNHPWSDIQNVPIATLSNKGIVQLIDSISSTDTTNAATPSSVKQAYDRGSSGIADASVAKKIAEDHVANKNNPHGTNKTDVGLSDVQNFNIATTTEAKAGVSEVKYMTPLLTFEAIKALQSVKSVNGKVGEVLINKTDVGLSNVDNVKQATKLELDNHLTDKNNPHGVTKKQLGLENVDDVKQASKVDFDTLKANYEAHLIGSNPHKVTKTDVNLWNVDNVQQASKVDFETHISANNPHRVNKSTIGLWNVENVQQASKVEFETHLQDSDKHVTNYERNNWNNKATTSTATQSSNGLMSSLDKKKLDKTELTRINPNGISYGETVILDENVQNFEAILVTFSFSGNRHSGTWTSDPNLDFRTSAINLDDSPSSSGWVMGEAVYSITGGRTLTCISSKTIDFKGSVTNSDKTLILAHVYGLNRI